MDIIPSLAPTWNPIDKPVSSAAFQRGVHEASASGGTLEDGLQQIDLVASELDRATGELARLGSELPS